MITLGGVDLNADSRSDMIWTNRYSYQSIAMETERTLGGRLVVRSGAMLAGIPITLESAESYGWITRLVLDQLKELAETLSMQYTLSYDSVLYNVMFRHSDAPAIDMQPLNARQSVDTDDKFIGQIKLITV